MDLIAPNAAIMKTGFVQLGVIVIFIVASMLKRGTSTAPAAIWLKLNTPLVSIVLGEAWVIASYVLFRPVELLDEYFIAGLWVAGGSSLMSSILKDATDGSIKTASVSGVVEMRGKQKGPRGGGGIGA